MKSPAQDPEQPANTHKNEGSASRPLLKSRNGDPANSQPPQPPKRHDSASANSSLLDSQDAGGFEDPSGATGFEQRQTADLTKNHTGDSQPDTHADPAAGSQASTRRRCDTDAPTRSTTDDSPFESGTVRRNFLSLALYQVVVRIGWIFKTESIIIPAVMDAIGGTATMRGFLPLLNRFGHSFPPLLLARRVKVTRYKKLGLAMMTIMMGSCFVILAALLWVTNGTAVVWLPYAFLVIYAAFFVLTGVNQLFFSTLQGKVIPATARGRQMLAANIAGAICAIAFAFWLLPGWLSSGGGEFHLIFGFAGLCFVLSALVVFMIKEAPDNYQDAPISLSALARQTWRSLRYDPSLRKMAYAAICFGCTMILFPHYQALAREKLGLDFTNLMIWVVVQNSGTAVFSLVAGLVADRFGNRLALRGSLLLSAGAPALAVLLAMVGPEARNWFPLVFLLVGMTPVTIKLFINYTLELAVPADHAQYVSTLGLCVSAPIIALSPLVGYLVGAAGFTVVFIAVGGVILLGWVQTFFIPEPRNRALN